MEAIVIILFLYHEERMEENEESIVERISLFTEAELRRPRVPECCVLCRERGLDPAQLAHIPGSRSCSAFREALEKARKEKL